MTKDHFNFQTGNTDYELSDSEKSPVVMTVERWEGRSLSLNAVPEPKFRMFIF